MPFDDLRGFLAALDGAGQLLRVTDEVDAEPDLGAAAAAAARLGERAPALYFDSVRGFGPARIALNVHGSWANHAVALGMDPRAPAGEQVAEFTRRAALPPVPPVRKTGPPFGENTLEGDDADLFGVLPLFRLNTGDGGFFLDKAAVISRDPDAPDDVDRQNAGIYRMQVKGRRQLGLQPVPMHDIAAHLRTAEARGEDLPVAIAIGNDPVITIAAAMSLGYDESEYAMAGALRQDPVPLARGPLTGLDVPWGCEVLLEGRVRARAREIEGPFGEFTGHYTGGRRMPLITIDRISHRTAPVYETLYLGRPWTEIDYLLGPATCIPLLEQLRRDFPEVRAVNAMYTHGLAAIIATGGRFGGFARAVGLRALTTTHGLGYCKIVIVVDENVDPFNLPQVMWALSTKVNPARDVIRLPGMSVMALDPSSDPPGITGKLIIDATTPAAPDSRDRFEDPVTDPPQTAEWTGRLSSLLAAREQGHARG
ncbi:MAG TPA: non-oxidative hydroxyarylic acid decarboxylases subunit C [Trebonia sp.]